MNGNSTNQQVRQQQNEAQRLKQPYFNVTANTTTRKSLLFLLCRHGRSEGGNRESTTTHEWLHLAHASQARRLLSPCMHAARQICLAYLCFAVLLVQNKDGRTHTPQQT